MNSKRTTKTLRGARKSHDDDTVIIIIDGTELSQLIHALALSFPAGSLQLIEAHSIFAEGIIKLIDKADAEVVLLEGDSEYHRFEGSEGDAPFGDASEVLMFFAEGRSLRIKLPIAGTVWDENEAAEGAPDA